jgi:hypothetical protein
MNFDLNQPPPTRAARPPKHYSHHDLQCPLTQGLIPVGHAARLTSNGHDWHFDARHLNLWLAYHDTNPLTNQPARLSDVAEARPEFIAALREWVVAHPGHEEEPGPRGPSARTAVAKVTVLRDFLFRTSTPAQRDALRAKITETRGLMAGSAVDISYVLHQYKDILGDARMYEAFGLVQAIWPAPPGAR